MSEFDSSITAGSDVIVNDVFGKEHRLRALTGVEVEGHDFPVVWVGDPQHEGQRIPRPVESLRLAGTLEP